MPVYKADLTLDDRYLGELRMYLSLDRILRRELRELRMRLAATVVIVDVLLIAAVYLLLSLTVLRPVRAIERYAMAVSHGGHYEHPVVPAASAPPIPSSRWSAA